MKKNNEGFSLVEMIIAVAISSLVMMCIIALLYYATHSMQQTQSKVALQDQAQDITKHISSYTMEASDVIWVSGTNVLKVEKNTLKSDGSIASSKTFYYWMKNKCIYFEENNTEDYTTKTEGELPADKIHLLADDIEDFECSINTNADTGKKSLHITLKLQDDSSEFACDSDVYMRNQ